MVNDVTVGAVVSIAMLAVAVGEAGPLLPVASCAAFAFTPSVTVPLVGEVAVSVTV